VPQGRHSRQPATLVARSRALSLWYPSLSSTSPSMQRPSREGRARTLERPHARLGPEDRSRSEDERVPVKSLCPCSKEISDCGAHNQRSLVYSCVSPKTRRVANSHRRGTFDAGCDERSWPLERAHGCGDGRLNPAPRGFRRPGPSSLRQVQKCIR
jgi:hypothetical protein